MNKYNYKARDSEGILKRGIVEATDERQAAQIIRERGYILISLDKKGVSLFGDLFQRVFSRVGMNDLVNFTRQLSTMIGSGLVITDALVILKSQTQNYSMVKIIDEIQRDIEGGKSFSEALKKHPRVFDPIYVSLVRCGETAGVLNKILSRLADNLEKDRDFRAKIKGAMIYPVIIVGGMLLVGAIMMIFVIPKLLDLYQEFEATLPVATIVLMSISNFLTKFWWVGLLGLVGLIWGVRAFARTEFGREKIDSFLFSIPVIGKLRKAMMLTEFTRTLGLLINGGVLVVEALEVTEGALSSANFKKALSAAGEEVEKGAGLAVALAESGVFPPLLPQMVSVGEETGKLDEVLLKISSYFEQEAEVAIRALTTAVEPIVMVLLGIGVGFLIIAVIMPIYNLTSQF